MVININDIPPEGLTLEINRKLDLFDKGTASTICTAVLSIKASGEGIITIIGRVQAAPQLECSRCLKSFSHPLDAEVSLELAPRSSLVTSPDHELAKGELDREFYQGNEIDPVELIREQLLIALPMVPLHHPDCKGLCTVCGTDMNEAECNCHNDSQVAFGAFSTLKDLFKK